MGWRGGGWDCGCGCDSARDKDREDTPDTGDELTDASDMDELSGSSTSFTAPLLLPSASLS